jgi:hypothetical protein
MKKMKNENGLLNGLLSGLLNFPYVMIAVTC